MSARYLLDTSIFSQPLRKEPVIASLERWKDAGDAHCRVCAVSVAEVEFGLYLEGREQRWEKYRALLDGRIEVLPTDALVWSEFSKRKARQQKIGRMVADLDLLIAACATLHGLIVATLNSKDFKKIEGLAWEDWAT
jgi:tRNA(fMet)-specific endonuclease VapC